MHGTAPAFGNVIQCVRGNLGNSHIETIPWPVLACPALPPRHISRENGEIPKDHWGKPHGKNGGVDPQQEDVPFSDPSYQTGTSNQVLRLSGTSGMSGSAQVGLGIAIFFYQVRGRRETVNVRNVLPIIDDQSWGMDCHSASRSRVASREGNLRASKVRSTLIALAKWWGTYRYRSRRRGRGRICRKPPLKPAA
ncbi:hypothetical protein GX48_06556 [Paracoccidioides brasiliensis]|nr:hypothetical protein GX48_06556 [Paracoccidioides brasiliensis]